MLVTGRTNHLAVTAAVVSAAAGVLAGWACGVTQRRRLRHAALHDPLTGLYNRAGWNMRAASTIVRARRAGRAVAVGVVDLDWLKRVNDAFGHAAGDELLLALAQRLAEWVSDGLVARMGGDEFAVVLVAPRRLPPGWLDSAAVEIHQYLCRPVFLGGTAHELSVSLGFAAVTSAGVDASLRRADAVMYRAKQARCGQLGDHSLVAQTPFLPAQPRLVRHTGTRCGVYGATS